LDLRELTASVGVDAFLDQYVHATAAYTRLSTSSVDVLSVQAGELFSIAASLLSGVAFV
jgi:hypothetical protein